MNNESMIQLLSTSSALILSNTLCKLSSLLATFSTYREVLQLLFIHTIQVLMFSFVAILILCHCYLPYLLYQRELFTKNFVIGFNQCLLQHKPGTRFRALFITVVIKSLYCIQPYGNNSVFLIFGLVTSIFIISFNQ